MITLQTAILLTILGVGIGFSVGYLIRILVALSKKNSIELDIKKMMIDARERAEKVTLDAEKKASETLKSAREQVREREDNIIKGEERLAKKDELLEMKEVELQSEAEALKIRVTEIKAIKDRVDSSKAEIEAEIQKVAGLSKEQAEQKLLQQIEAEAEKTLSSRLYKLENFATESLEQKAKEILAVSIQRLAVSVPADLFSTCVPIVSEDDKGKIIGKEGRNIKAFEKATGVEVLVDDQPDAIMLSSFDPIRRQIARIALERLLQDGRIQPAKIEKEVELAQEAINKVIKDEGERAIYETGITPLDPRITAILGRLHFRTSYGQNVLQHSIECAHIAGMIAEELGANVNTAKTGALVHDIGKALDHEVQGTHVEIGRKILQKFGASEEIVKSMEAHHEEYPYETVESRIVQTADAISGGRPGARKDNAENYIKRLTELEQIAKKEKGVEKVYALQAGREIRVFVHPDVVSDMDAKNMAINIAKNIEEELKYPGEIKVHIIRETRVVEYAR
ncbi:MAG: ribonuclease Y [Candidatus Pacebacteria bacterium]|nr:ribonuclease Y [Candidatus Paceibacterota bacterium]